MNTTGQGQDEMVTQHDSGEGNIQHWEKNLG